MAPLRPEVSPPADSERLTRRGEGRNARSLVVCIFSLSAFVALAFREITGDFERITRWKRVLELPIEFALDVALLLFGRRLFGHDDASL